MMLRPGCRDVPAQGLTPPLHPRKGFRPLTRFRWRDPVELVESAVSIADASIRSETPLSFRGTLGCRPDPRRCYRRPCTRARGIAP